MNKLKPNISLLPREDGQFYPLFLGENMLYLVMASLTLKICQSNYVFPTHDRQQSKELIIDKWIKTFFNIQYFQLQIIAIGDCVYRNDPKFSDR